MFRWTGAASTGWSWLHRQASAVLAEIPDARSPNRETFGAQESAPEFEVPAKPAEFPRRGDHAMTRDVRPPAIAHDIPNRARGTGSSRGFRHVAVGGDLADRNASDYRQ